MSRSRRQATLLVCLIELLCFHGGGGLSAGCSGSSRQCLRQAYSALGAGLDAGRGNRIRGRYRSVARQASHGVYPSVARTPLPPGGGNGVYEGEKNEKEKKEESDFNRGVGKVIDTLRRDYPTLLDEPLDFDIYTPDVQLRDPSGVVLTGLPAYKRMFATFRFARKTLVHDVSTVFRLSYDGSRQQVRVTWHFILDATPMVARPVHIDGTSVYSLSTQGLVRRHDVETIIVNGTPVTPPFAKAWMQLPSWVTQGLKKRGTAGRAVPGRASGLTSSTSGGVVSVGSSGGFSEGGRGSGISDGGGFINGGSSTSERRASNTRISNGERMIPMALGGAWGATATGGGGGGTVLAFQGLATVAAANVSRRRTGAESGAVVAAVATRRGGERTLGVDASSGSSSSSSSSSSSRTGGSVWSTASETVVRGSEDVEGEAGVSSSLEGGKGEAGGSADRDEDDGSSGGEDGKASGRKKPKSKKKGLWPIEYDGPLACETSFDCTGGYVCCDLIVVKICCSNGVMQRKPGDLIPSLIPIPGRGRTELDQCYPHQLA